MDCNYSFVVVGRAVVIVSDADRLAMGTDVINSLLLAQLVANKKVQRNPARNWYDACLQVLDDFWVRHSRAQNTWRPPQDSSESAVDWINAAMGNGNLNEGQTIAAAVKRLAAVPGADPAIDMLRKHLQGDHVGASLEAVGALSNTRLLVVLAQSPNSLTSVYLEFQSHLEVGPNPFAQLYRASDMQGSICMRYDQAQLAEVIYGPVRKAIALKVQGKLEANVAVVIESEAPVN
ncbi:hypothetical protein [Pseudomonas sp. McL0111]|uniref:hypothetical protein n=1 Tax=Pseudomonas sp. McL0111 TaxID=3457357 RepID=UPI00403EB282